MLSRVAVLALVVASMVFLSWGGASAQYYRYPPDRDEAYGSPYATAPPADVDSTDGQFDPYSTRPRARDPYVSGPTPIPPPDGRQADSGSYRGYGNPYGPPPGYSEPDDNSPWGPYGGPRYSRGSIGPDDNPFRSRPPVDVNPQQSQPGTAALPPEYRPESSDPKELAPNLHRQLVAYDTREPAGTIVIDTPHTYLYLVLGHGEAIRYGIGVGREGFTWSGTERISRMSEWPDWYPPVEMIQRQPYLPRMMAGGPGNPLGARALYLGNTLYRIHGTNQPSTIGQTVSSGCIRLLNEDIEDLYSRVTVGSRAVVLPGHPPRAADAVSH